MKNIKIKLRKKVLYENNFIYINIFNSQKNNNRKENKRINKRIRNEKQVKKHRQLLSVISFVMRNFKTSKNLL